MSDAFENSIRKKLNEADIPFDQEAWSKMESLLDGGEKKKRPGGWWWWLFLLPLLGGIGWWMISSNNVKPPYHPHAHSPVENNFDSVVTSANTTPTPDQSTVVSKATKPAIAKGAQNEVANLPGALTSSPNKLNHLPTNKQGVHLPKKNINTDSNSIPDSIITSGKTITTDKEVVMATSSYNIDLIKIKKLNNVDGYTKLNNIPELPIDTSITPYVSHKVPRRKINNKGLYFGVTLGPDLNVAPSFNYGKVGFNAGVLAHYYFNSRWFVTTGAVYSKKLYGATRNDYKSSYMPYDLVKVNANCDVLDIPVNMNYTFLQANNNTVSATLGLSNYFMLKEQYQYIYKYTPTWDKTVENQNQHYLAILNVGALYQHPAGRRLIVGVQPYAKIPLRGVGLGQVKLYSAGISFQLNLLGKKR
ncbi:MAG: outer membrane beta-barrel protein [Chitinophaga sp.]|uniref:outer membrane beta-barrel protein n=1 Tax=Chitinophaga sp. TaxID=1869181 RepID=UPI001B061BE2|nr:outer membrane beta-barrel protein [Chitinophaga sp.]MBO9727082.1 outer membrane beta-barrel protein [Chitinophaga sp.]